MASNFAAIKAESNVTRAEIIDIFSKSNYDHLFRIIPYNICLGILLQVIYSISISGS